LVCEVAAGRTPVPKWTLRKRRVERELWRMLDLARERVADQPIASLYRDRIDELELELVMIDSLGDPKRVRPIAARRFGTGALPVHTLDGPAPVARVARALLEALPHREEPREIPAYDLAGRPSLTLLMLATARHAGLDIEVKVEPRLTAGAATGDRTIFIADRMFGRREALRFAVHEVLGHAVAAANARDQPLRIFEIGTAGSFSAQEGLALCLEERAGVLDAYRLRTLAARVLATDRMHAAASFGETARWLHTEHNFSAADAVAIAERAYRGGGVARDVGYLHGWLEVRAALESGAITIDQLRTGRLGLPVVRVLDVLEEAGLARAPRYRPSLARSLFATDAGTSRETSAPSIAASLTMLEET
jgi:uncharacterized protein (TIGR02421 family)